MHTEHRQRVLVDDVRMVEQVALRILLLVRRRRDAHHSRIYRFGGRPCCHVDPEIDEDDDDHWDVEGAGSGEDDVDTASIGRGASARSLLVFDGAGEEETRRADQKTADPDDGDSATGSELGDEHRIVERLDDGDVSIDRDGHQVVDRGGAHPDVQCQPDSTPRLTEYPVLIEHFVGYAERKDHSSDEKISEGKAQNQKTRC